MIIALDPGTIETAVICINLTSKRFVHEGVKNNEDVLIQIKALKRTRTADDVLAIEMVACYGMPVGHEVFETCVWIGRFIEAWDGRYELIYRKDVKIHFCNDSRAKDPNIRQALIDRFGPVGTKNNPGVLYGIKSHLWAALAVGVYYADSEKILNKK